MSPARAIGCLIAAGILAGLLYGAGWRPTRRGGGPTYTAEDLIVHMRSKIRARGVPAALGDHIPSIMLLDPEDRPYLHVLPDDDRPVVIWFWSCLCRCVRDCEERIVDLVERYPPERVHFFAVDSNPDDSAFDIHRLRTAMDSPYEVYRDVRGTTARYLGVDASASVAILDKTGRIRYRGAIDDDLYDPTVSYVHEALDAIFADRDLARTTAPSYGCRYPLPAAR